MPRAHADIFGKVIKGYTNSGILRVKEKGMAVARSPRRLKAGVDGDTRRGPIALALNIFPDIYDESGGLRTDIGQETLGADLSYAIDFWHSLELPAEHTEEDCLQVFIDGYDQMAKDPSMCQQGSSTEDVFDFPQDPEAFNAQYFDLPDGIICRAWQATASEVSINMKIDFALTRAGPRIDPPPYSVQVMETGQFVPEQMGLVKISPKFLRYALTPRGDPTKQLGEISFLYPKIWLYSQRPPHPTHDV